MALTSPEFQRRYVDRDEAMARAYRSGAYTMAMVAAHFGVHSMTVSRAVRKWERVAAPSADAGGELTKLRGAASG